MGVSRSLQEKFSGCLLGGLIGDVIGAAVEAESPGFVAFGSNGGGEMLAFDAEGRVFMIPFVGMSVRDAKPIAASWSEFVEKIEM
jgi:hypothetical protein